MRKHKRTAISYMKRIVLSYVYLDKMSVSTNILTSWTS